MTSRAACRPAAEDAPLSERDFRRYQQLIHAEAGIYLSEVKRALVVGRLARRLRELGLRSYGEYLDRVLADEGERVRMLDCICTNETHFFREPQQFELLRQRVFAEWEREAEQGRRERRLRVWSAACSTGEEPYSLAMVLLERFPPEEGWSVEVLASDLSTRALERAREARWPIQKKEEIPASWLRRYMLRGTGSQEGWMKAGPEVRAAVRFSRVNLHRTACAGPFDAIFCRNVLIYFSAEARADVLQRLVEQLRPRGYLFLGHAETLAGSRELECVVPNVYRSLREAPVAPAPRGALAAGGRAG